MRGATPLAQLSRQFRTFGQMSGPDVRSRGWKRRRNTDTRGDFYPSLREGRWVTLAIIETTLRQTGGRPWKKIRASGGWELSLLPRYQRIQTRLKQGFCPWILSAHAAFIPFPSWRINRGSMGHICCSTPEFSPLKGFSFACASLFFSSMLLFVDGFVIFLELLISESNPSILTTLNDLFLFFLFVYNFRDIYIIKLFYL